MTVNENMKADQPVVTAQTGRGCPVPQRPQGAPTGSTPHWLRYRLYSNRWQTQHGGGANKGGWWGGGGAEPKMESTVIGGEAEGGVWVWETPLAWGDTGCFWLAAGLTNLSWLREAQGILGRRAGDSGGRKKVTLFIIIIKMAGVSGSLVPQLIF